MADEPSFRRVTPGGVGAALILPFQLTDAVLRPDGDQGKNGVPVLPVEAVLAAMRVGFAGGLEWRLRTGRPGGTGRFARARRID